MSVTSPGRRAVVTELAEDPPAAIAHALRVEPQPRPDTARLAPTDVVIAVKSAAVGWVDLLMTSGQYQHAMEPPYCPGLEYSGEVLWRGEAVSHVDVGDAVIADPFLTGPRSLGDYQRWGGFASYAVAPAEAVIPLPSTLTFDQGCHLLGPYETAHHVLLDRGALQPGETVLVHGASGTTGLAAVHVAKLTGARVIATGRSTEKLAVVASQGADHVLCTDNGSGGLRRFRDDVKALTDGRGVDVVYDGVGGAISLESLRCVRFGARFLIAGWAATPFVARGKGRGGAPNANVLPTNLIMMKSLDVLGCPAAITAHRAPARREARRDQVMAWARAGAIAPLVTEVFPLSKVADAMKTKWESRFVGGCALHPEE